MFVSCLSILQWPETQCLFFPHFTALNVNLKDCKQLLLETAGGATTKKETQDGKTEIFMHACVSCISCFAGTLRLPPIVCSVISNP